MLTDLGHVEYIPFSRRRFISQQVFPGNQAVLHGDLPRVTTMETEFFLPADHFCQGFSAGREQTIEQWLDSQEIGPYQSMNEAYKDITLHEYLLHKEVKLTVEESKLFYFTCYNLDKFRRFLFESTFFDRFDVPGETIARVASSDEHLLDFSYKWIRFSLFHDPIFRIKNSGKKNQIKNPD